MNENKKLNNEEYEIDLRELWFLFLSKLKFIIIFALVGAVIAASVTMFLITPKYKATSRLYVVSASNDAVVNLSDLQIGTNLTLDYKELVLGRPVLESCISDLKLNYSVGALRSMIAVDNPSNTRILNITVTSTDPVEAKDIANKMASLAVTWLPEVMESNSPHIAENAVVPSSQSSPNLFNNCVIGGFALAVIYFIVCTIKHLLDDTIKTTEELEKYFGLIPLAVVPEIKGKGGSK